MNKRVYHSIVAVLMVFCATSCGKESVPVSQPAPGVTDKTLILYYTRTGNNETVAKAVSNLIKHSTIEQVKSDVSIPASATWYKLPFTKAKIDPLEANPDDFSNIILCTPVYLQGIAPPIKAVIKDFPLKGKNVAVLATCGGMYFSLFQSLVKSALKRRGANARGVYVVKVGGKSEEEITLQVEAYLKKTGLLLEQQELL